MSGDPQQIKNPSRMHSVIAVNSEEIAESVDLSESMSKKVTNNGLVWVINQLYLILDLNISLE